MTWQRIGRGKTDGEGMNTNDLMDILFQVAEEESVRLAFHLEPYPGRTAASVRADIQYFFDKWGQSPALYRDPERYGTSPLSLVRLVHLSYLCYFAFVLFRE